MISFVASVARESVTGLRLLRRQVRSDTRLRRAGFYASLGLTLLVSLFPFYVMFATSITTDDAIYVNNPSLLPREVTLSQYAVLFSSETFAFTTYFVNSAIVATVTATFSLFVGVIGAYSFTRLSYPGNTLIRRGVVVVYMLSAITVVVPLFQLIARLGLVDTRLSLFITYTVSTLPLTLYMLWNYFESLPVAIEEAAMLDGYSRVETIFRVVVPLSLPVLVATFLFAFKIAWNEYIFASVFLKSQAKLTLPIGIEQMNADFSNVWGQIMAASFLTTLPIVVMFLYLEKYMVEGLTAGAVEG
ncbi:carbohydrate ABC transporter permease [Halogeometricum limi]|uniref:Multiple sugar transport system permease protein n=1 Tax=Halogeometricum limi TaxID=555875 RepID=A0A1I6IA35_9EURY|nr:carbohydrate ABC transporter permease [Halogeometricum limi]SFR63498.1 multiple sugar transport system permease protein [Halogeometricum limi]